MKPYHASHCLLHEVDGRRMSMGGSMRLPGVTDAPREVRGSGSCFGMGVESLSSPSPSMSPIGRPRLLETAAGWARTALAIDPGM
jgi:hypothetical protein